MAALHKSLGEVDFGPASAIVASIVLAFLFDYISWLPFASGWIAVPFQSLAMLAPIFAAIVLGRFANRTSTIACLAIGIIAGFGGFAAHIIVWAFGALQSAYSDCVAAMNHVPQKVCTQTELLPPHWYVSVITYPIAGALLFVSGHGFGRMLSPSPFQAWVNEEVLIVSPDNRKRRRSLEAVIGILTAILPKLIEYWIDHANAGH